MNKRHLIFLGAYLAIIIAALVVWVLPTYALIQGQRTKIYDQRVKLEQQKQRFSDAKSLTQQYTKIKEDVKELEAVFLSKDPDEILSFIDRIDAFAAAQSVTNSVQISPLPDSNDKKLTKSDITVTAKGAYRNVLTFISQIESMPEYANFTTVDFSSKTDSDTNAFSLTLKGSIYWK